MTTKNRGLGNVFRPTRACLKCGRAGCEHCGGTGQRQLKTWWIQYSHRGKQYRETAKTYSRKAAVKFLKKRLSEIGADREFAGPAAERTTFEDLSAMLVADYEVNGRKSLRRAKIALMRLGDFFAGSFALDITTDRINRYIARRLEDGMAPGTVRNEVTVLRRAFNLAQQARKVTQLPHFPTIEVRNVRTGFFDREEFELVLTYLPDGLSPVAEFAYLTGWRISEILGLRWTQVDLKARVVRLEVGTTKNDEGRVLPFHVLPRLADLLRRQRERTDRKERALGRVIPWVFHRRGEKIKYIKGAWRRACQKAGCPGRLFHDLRRTAVRNLERAGVPRSIAMKITGHKTESVYRRYAIVSERDVAEGLERLGAFLTKS